MKTTHKCYQIHSKLPPITKYRSQEELPHFCWPEREEADSNDAEDDGGAGDVVVPGRRVVQPDVRLISC